jgi:hypothetical protein
MHFREAYDPFRALRSAWDLLWKAPLVLLVGGLLLYWTWPSDSGPAAVQFEQRSDGRIDPVDAARFVAAAGFACCFAIAVFLFHALLRIGFARVVERVASGAKADFGELFTPRGLFGSMVGTLLLVLVILLASFAPLALVAAATYLAHATIEVDLVTVAVAVLGAPVALAVFAYVMLGVVLAPDAVAFEAMRPTEAIARSWILTRGNRWCLFLYLLILGITRWAGLLLCCVGSLVTIPWTMTAGRESYLRMVRDDPPR